MTSWDDEPCRVYTHRRSCQSAPPSQKTSPIIKSACRVPGSPLLRSTMSNPKTNSHASSASRMRRCHTPEAVAYEPDHRYHRHTDHDNCMGGYADADVKGDLKGFYENLLRAKDDIIKTMEKKVECLQRDLAYIKHSKDKEIDMLQQAAETNSRLAENEYEKRLNETMADAEKQKVCLHREHTRRVQDLLATTSKRLQKMEESYGDRISHLTRMVDELECKLTMLSKDMEQTVCVKNHLKEERDNLDSEYCCIQEQYHQADHKLREALQELEVARDKICQLEMEKATIDNESRRLLEDTRRHLECEIQLLKEKNEEIELQCNCKIAAVEEGLCSMQETLKQKQDCFTQRLKDAECKHQQTMQCFELQHKKELQEMQHEIDCLVRDYSTRMKALELSISEKERQLCQLKNQMQCQVRDYEEKLSRERDSLCRCEQQVQDKTEKIEKLCEQLADMERQRECQVEEVCRQLEDQKRIYADEIRDYTCKLNNAQRMNELQTEDFARQMEEEKRRCDEKVTKVSEQLKQSLCLYEKEAHDLSKQLEDEQRLRCNQVRDLTEEVHRCKQQLNQQADQYVCQLEEEKRCFRKQIQDLSCQVEQFRAMCEKQSMDYSHQLDDERRLHDEQMQHIKCQHEVEKQEMSRRYQKEMDSQKRDPQNYVRCLEEKFTKLLTEAEDKSWEQEQCYLKRITELESQLHQLKCELSQQCSGAAHKGPATADSYDCCDCTPKPEVDCCGRITRY